MKNNDSLKKYIIAKYGSFAKFSKKENFPPHYLETIFYKNDIFYEMGIGIKVCSVLNIDIEKLFCCNEIVVLESKNPENTGEDSDISIDDIIKEKYLKLSDDERKKALDYANFILENGLESKDV